MSANYHIVALGREQGFFYHHWVAGMKAASDISLIDKGHYLVV